MTTQKKWYGAVRTGKNSIRVYEMITDFDSPIPITPHADGFIREYQISLYGGTVDSCIKAICEDFPTSWYKDELFDNSFMYL